LTLLVGVVAFAVTVAATPVAIVAARRYGIVDRPGELKLQDVPIPYLGGVAVFAGLIIGAAVGRPTVLVPLGAALVLGVTDDRFDIPALWRLAGEVVIAVAVIVTCPIHLPGGLGAVLLVIVVILVVNGMNLIDGLDMLAAGVAAVAGIGFALVLHGSARQLAVALTGALLGFLVFNRPPARIYLGDGGSYLVGTALAVLVAEAWAPGVPDHIGVAAVALIAVPVGEVALSIVRRARSRRSLMAGDRGHPYDQLVRRGWPRPAASLAYIGFEALLAVGVVTTVHAGSLAGSVTLDVVAALLVVVAAGATGALRPDEEERQ
jgi:UDP-GlcNAc:undecaprenyl-phosphate/decaprenyl-phosphate GlcNAc-1-phosphate transferase